MSKAARTAVAFLIVLTGLSLIADHPLIARSGGKKVQPKKWFTYEQVFGGGLTPAAPRPGEAQPAEQIMAPPLVITGWADDEHYLETREDPADKQRKSFSVSVADGSATLYRDPNEIQKAIPKDFRTVATTADGKGVLLSGNNDLHFLDVATKKVRQLTATPAQEQYPRLSPNGRFVVYSRDHNLYLYDLQNSVERQMTADGSDVILNGYSSWVYMEEILGRGEGYGAYWWSPDSAKLAFLRFDDSPVPVFPIYHAGREPYTDPAWQHGTLEIQHYPKAGDPNPYVQMGVVNVADGKIAWMDFDPKADHYIAWPYWTPDGKSLLVQWLNRQQDTLRFFVCDPATGKKTQIFEERQPTWIDFFKDITFLEKGQSMLIRSDRDGWEHLYVYGIDGKLKRRLTSGEFRVRSIQKVDEKNGYVYFTAAPTKAWDSHLMRVKLDGTAMEQITKADGSHRTVVSPNGRYFVDTVSAIDNPGGTSLYRIDGTLVRTLGSAKGRDFDAYAWGKGEIFTIKSDDGLFDLPAYWILPPGFDPKDTRKQYPLIFSIYGGPDSGTVSNSWKGYSAHYWAQRGVITISVDHRGGGAFGRRGLNYLHRSLGRWEMTDLITATKWLRSKPFVAKDKVGIAGGSYGGYTTLMALFKAAGPPDCPDGPCFNYGQAGSSVSAWELYDTVYTERYMDTPKENPEGYKAGAVLTYKDRYKGGLLITHGTIDDNVHTQNSTQVIDWLTANNKPFEMMYYPESRHGITQRAFSARLGHDFWVKTLLNGKMPTPPVVPGPAKKTMG